WGERRDIMDGGEADTEVEGGDRMREECYRSSEIPWLRAAGLPELWRRRQEKDAMDYESRQDDISRPARETGEMITKSSSVL
ncbi:hypothetical protein TNCV_4068831, partial [Trichonephila clavipes]